MEIERAIKTYDYEVLEMILPHAARVVLDGDNIDGPPEYVFLYTALSTPIAKRRLLCGREYEIRGVKTIDILFTYAFEHGIAVEDFLSDLLLAAVIGGNDDLFQHCALPYMPIQSAMNSFSLSKRVNYEDLLHAAISCVQRDIFKFLLSQGVDPNGSQGEDLHPLQSAVRLVGHDAFFFHDLLPKLRFRIKVLICNYIHLSHGGRPAVSQNRHPYCQHVNGNRC
jgi:hypothetical protein